MQYITSNTTLSTANTDIIIDASAGKVKATLPLASTTTGIPFFIKCISVTYEARLTATGSSVGDGDFLFSFAGQQITVVSDGSNYEIQSRDTDTLTTKVYRALLSQSGTDAPTVDAVLENTTGATITFSYTGVGAYKANADSSIFISNKTAYNLSPMGTISQVSYGSEDFVTIKTFDAAGVAENGWLNITYFEILIYP